MTSKKCSRPGKSGTVVLPLKLTALQRSSLIECTRLKGSIRRKIEEAEEGTQVVHFTVKELELVYNETGKTADFAPDADRRRLFAVEKKVADLLDEIELGATSQGLPGNLRRSASSSKLLFQFKITLLGTSPAIWRRIQVVDCTLDRLHEHIQTAMGWTNSHLHHFRIDNQFYGDPLLMAETFAELGYADSTSTMLSDILPRSGKQSRFLYEYDFGDSWEHEVLFEGCPSPESGRNYPWCLEGDQACPPDDVGGVWGYADFVKAIQDPDHPQHVEMLEWVGDRFDPNAFNPAMATKAMKKGLPDWRRLLLS